jgi:hypothetical protein
MAKPASFDDFLRTLQPVTLSTRPAGNGLDAMAEAAAATIAALPDLTPDSLAGLVRAHPEWVPLLALCVGLTQEQLKNRMRHHFDTSSWIKLARQKPADLIAYLDEEHGLLDAVMLQRQRTWSFADVLKERLRWSRRTGVRATARGRQVENVVEEVLRNLGLPYQMRTTFVGRAGETAPCDFGVPKGGEDARIVGGAKGFDSTGSKLTDFVREVQEMADKRLARQFVLVVVDGIGWKNRAADLRRVWELYQKRAIDGLYTLAMLDEFEHDVRQAAQLRGLL